MYLWKPKKYRWLPRLAYSIDQTFNAMFSPYLNFFLDPKEHLFGHPDETVSSVIGKNMLTDDRKHWKYIEKILVFVLEGNKRSHSDRAIEKDEGYRK
jgi:hypothetical protein